MAHLTRNRSSLPQNLLFGFVAGFLATLTFHQVVVSLLVTAGAIPTGAYVLRSVPPFGAPQVVSLAFWAGLWGCVWALVADRLPRGPVAWIARLMFGVLAPTLFGWFVVASLKGQPIAAGWNPAKMWIAPVGNAAWGLGTALFYGLLRRWNSGRRRPEFA
jgi:hypothetical protein